MKRLYLASSIDRTAKSVANDIGKKNLKLAFITTASEVEDPPFNWQNSDRKGLIDAGFKLFDYSITGKNNKQIENDLENFDVIHVNGGNTSFLLAQARKSGFDKWLIYAVNKGIIYIGSSAGSILCGPEIPEYLIGKQERKWLYNNSKSLNLVNFVVAAHWGSKEFKNKYLSDRLKIAYKYNWPPFLLLTDYQYVKVVDDFYKIIDVREK